MMEDFNPLASADMAENVAEMYLTAAKQRHALMVLQVANGCKDDDPVPGTRPKLAEDGETVIIENGKPVFPTYAEQRAEYQATMDRLRLAFESVWPTVEKLLQERKLQMAAQSS